MDQQRAMLSGESNSLKDSIYAQRRSNLICWPLYTGVELGDQESIWTSHHRFACMSCNPRGIDRHCCLEEHASNG